MFSSNARIVSGTYQGKPWSIVRPLLVPWQFTALGDCLWVDPNGKDTNPGTSKKPLATISHAASLVSPGDIVYINAGNYVDQITLRTSGIAGAPIVFSCAPGALGKVTITTPASYVTSGTTGFGKAVFAVNGGAQEYIWINGLVVQGPLGKPEGTSPGADGFCGISFENGAGAGCQVTNCIAYNNPHCGLKIIDPPAGATPASFGGNVVYGNGSSNLDHGIYVGADLAVFLGNICFGNSGYGLCLYAMPQKQQVERNICMANALGGLLLAGAFSTVRNNILVGNSYGLQYYTTSCHDNVVEQNIAAFNTTADMCWEYFTPDQLPFNNTDDYNCYYPNTVPGVGQPALGPHDLVADPLFVDRASWDFRLTPGSPCWADGMGAYS